MKFLYKRQKNSKLIINFVFLDGQTLCYTDLIKVGVALDDGELLFLEATGYIYNHTDSDRKKGDYKMYNKGFKFEVVKNGLTGEILGKVRENIYGVIFKEGDKIFMVCDVYESTIYNNLKFGYYKELIN